MVKPASFFCALLIGLGLHAQIHIDPFGYLPDMRKVAVLANPQEGFNAGESYQPGNTLEVLNLDDEVVFSAAPQQWNFGLTDPVSGDKGWILDFTALTTPGAYRISDPETGVLTEWFTISDAVYNNAMTQAGRMFFLNRCSAEKPIANAYPWDDTASFNNPGQDTECTFVGTPTDNTTARDLHGGWFDAGDYNKYITFAESAVANLLEAHLQNPHAFSDDWNIPESGNGLPDVLDELMWELRWVYRMTNEDGSCILKMGSTDYSLNALAPPSANTDPRHYSVTCTSASWSAAHMLAKACFHEDFYLSAPFEMDAWFNRAQDCWAYGKAALDNNALETGCDNGEILSGDADLDYDAQLQAAVCGAVYLFALTGEQVYQDFLITYAPQLPALADNYWSPYTLRLGDALLHYLELPNADAELSAQITASLTQYQQDNWDGWMNTTGNALYQAFVPEYMFHWGSNQVMAAAGCLQYQCAAAPEFPLDNLDEKAAAHLHYLNGVNPLGLCYLSNMGVAGAENSVTTLYHGWFADGTEWDSPVNGIGPPPGYLVGGPNQWFSVETLSPPANQPPAKSYLDFNDDWPNNSWEVSEPAIYYQALYVRLLSHFIPGEVADDIEEWAIDEWALYPNPAADRVTFSAPLRQNARVYAPDGTLVAIWPKGSNEAVVEDWKAGWYVVQRPGKAARTLIKQ